MAEECVELFDPSCEHYYRWVSLCDHVEDFILLPFISIQMSMAIFLVLHGHKEKAFRQAFYVFFVAVTIVDCALVVVVSRSPRE
jgi:hypothetical protein